MTIAYVAGTTGPNSSTTSETLSMPTGYNTAGNMTIAAFCNEGSLAITPPTGSFSATNTEPVVAWSTLIKVTPPPTVVRPPQQMCLT